MIILKIILSRKGFDSKAGGYPSPILPDGTLVSLPIPEENTGIYYKDLKINTNLSYLDLMKQLGITKYDEKSTTHLDPDINPSIIQRQNNWECIFGQDNQSASHLDNQSVDVGDIFLFFGWFRNVIEVGGKYKYDPEDKNGKHIIWGYLEIGKKIAIDTIINYPPHYQNHPHFKNRNRQNNTAFISNDTLSFNNTVNGAGTLKYNENLVLSFDDNKKSIWKLPLFFHPSYGTTMTYHEDLNKWNNNGYFCNLESVGRGQEFVIYGNPCVEQWAKDIILNNI